MTRITPHHEWSKVDDKLLDLFHWNSPQQTSRHQLGWALRGSSCHPLLFSDRPCYLSPSLRSLSWPAIVLSCMSMCALGAVNFFFSFGAGGSGAPSVRVWASLVIIFVVAVAVVVVVVCLSSHASFFWKEAPSPWVVSAFGRAQKDRIGRAWRVDSRRSPRQGP